MDISREKGFQRAARLLMLLGREEAAQVLQHLSEKEVEGITREIASTEKLDVREAARVLEEFGYRAGGGAADGERAAGKWPGGRSRPAESWRRPWAAPRPTPS